MKSDANIERLNELAPVRDDDLVSETRTPEARALLPGSSRHHWMLRRRPAPTSANRAAGAGLRSPRFGAAVAVSAVAVLVSSGGNATPSAAAATLRKAASIARVQAPPTPGPGQYVYTKSINAYTNTIVPVGGAAAAYAVLVRRVREAWLGPDGGRLLEFTGTPEFLTAQDRARWIAAGRPDLTEAPSENKLQPSRPSTSRATPTCSTPASSRRPPLPTTRSPSRCSR